METILSTRRELIFAKLFPFYFTIDVNWNIVSFGPSFSNRFSEIKGEQFHAVFEIVNPTYLKDDKNALNLEGKIIVFKMIETGLLFRGQFILIENLIYFSGNPWINSIEDLSKSNITFSDFSLADNTIDLLQLIQLQNQGSKELKKITTLLNQKNKELSQSGKKLHKIIQSSNDLVFELNSDLIYIDVWASSEKDLFFKKEEIIGKHVIDLFPDSYGSYFVNSLNYVIQKKTKLNIEYKHPKDNKWYSAEINYFDIEGEISVTKSVKNVTALKKHQDDILTSNARLATLISNLQGGVLLENENREIVLVNQAFCNIFSIPVSPQKMIGMDCSKSAENSAPLFKNPEQFISRINEILKNKTIVTTELLEMANDRLLERDFIPIYEGKNYLGHLWKYTDVTEKYKANERIRRIKEKYERIIQNMGMGYLEVDNDGKIMQANKRMLEMLNYKTENDLLGKIASKLFIKEDALTKKVKKIVDRRLAGKSDVYEFPINRSDGTILHSLISGAPLYGENNEIIGSIGLHLDLTKQKEIERQLKKQTEIALKAADAKQTFLANMSHEIRTPLNAIVNSISLLSESEDLKGRNDLVEIIKNASQSLVYLVNDILDEVKMDEGKIEIEKRVFPIKKTIENIYFQQKLVSDKKNIELFLKIDNTIPDELMGDTFRLSQILNNLISNAIKFTEKGKVNINISFSKIKGNMVFLYFEVTDTGIGISNKYFKNLFEPFSQEDNSVTRKYGGSGLGLKISKDLIELMGGKLFVESRKNKGSKFYFILPFEKSSASANHEILDNPIDKEKLRNIKLALVDDNAINQLLASELIKKHIEDVICFSSAKNLIDYLKDNTNKKPGIILMDLQMPEIDGLKATRIIRKSISTTIPIIGFSANAFATHIRRAKAAGMNDYISKPFEINNLLQKISNQLTLEKSFNYYNRTELLKQLGGDLAIEKKLCDTFIKVFDNKCSSIISFSNSKDHKAFRALIHELKPSVKMFITGEYAKYFDEIEMKSKKDLKTVTLKEIDYFFCDIIKETVKEIKDLYP